MTAPPARPTDAPSEVEKRIIVLDRPNSAMSRAACVFERDSLEVYFPPLAQTAIALCKRKRFDLVFISYPMLDMPLADFLAELQAGLSPSSQPNLVVFAPPGELDGIIAPKLKVLTPPDTFVETEEMILSEIRQPRRAAVRLMARLEARLGDSRILRMCQTRNISARGVFVTTEHLTPIGTTMQLELTLHADELPVEVEVEVMRHARPSEGVKGLGLKFLRFSRNGAEQLERYLAQPKLWL